MQYVELVAILAVLQFIFFGFMTGQARSKSGLKAPATSGAENFERMYRVQTNTMELLVAFLPSLLIAGRYWSPLLISAIGLLYIVGRFIYWQAYIKDPSKRFVGFIVSLFPTVALALLSFFGVLMAMVKA